MPTPLAEGKALLRPARGRERVVTADAEAAVALRVSVAVIESGDVIPDADEMEVARLVEQPLVGAARAALQARLVAAGGDQPRAVAAPHFDRRLRAELRDGQRHRRQRMRRIERDDAEEITRCAHIA